MVKQKLYCPLFFKKSIWRYVFAISSILFCSLVFNRWIEGLAFCFAHTILKYKFKNTYHNDNYLLFLVNFIIWVSISKATSLSISLLFIPFQAFAICWLGSIIQEKILVSKQQEQQKVPEPKPFNTNTCTKEELLIRCQELRLSKDNIELAIAFFIDKTKHSILADKLCIEEKSVIMKKLRLKEKLNSNKSEL